MMNFVVMTMISLLSRNLAFMRQVHRISFSSKSATKQLSPVTELLSTVPTAVLEKGKARLFQDGNPLVYGGAIKELKGYHTRLKLLLFIT